MANNRHFFSIIEVVLAVCIMGIGLVYIMRLYGSGLRSARDSVARKFSADSVDHFLHLYALRLKNPTDDYANWENLGTSLPTAKPGATEPTSWSTWFREGNTTVNRAADGSTDVLHVIQQSSGATAPDFEAIYRIWRDTVKHSKYQGGTWQQVSISPSQALALNVEISWPVVAPYEGRQKSLYRFEVFKPASP